MNRNQRRSLRATLSLRPQNAFPLACHAFLTALVLLLALPLIPAALTQSRRIELNDYSKIVSVSDPQISPDGRSIVVAVSRPNLEQDRNDRELVSIDISTGTQRILTYERKGVGSPRWSPSGDRLAFVATDGAGKDARPQVFVLPMAGGEARKITEAPNGIEQFAWRPSGQDIAYVTSDEPANKKEMEKHHDAFEVGDNDFLATEAALPSHIWILPADGGKAKRLTSGAWSLPKSAPPSPPASPISCSPDGSRVAYWYPRDGDPNNENEIFVTQTVGGDGTDSTRAIDRCLVRAIWMPDGNSLLVGGHDATQTSLWVQPLSGAAKKLSLGDISPSWSFWVDAFVGRKGDIAFTGSTTAQPSELYYM